MVEASPIESVITLLHLQSIMILDNDTFIRCDSHFDYISPLMLIAGYDCAGIRV
jgi:hypothetical protein